MLSLVSGNTFLPLDKKKNNKIIPQAKMILMPKIILHAYFDFWSSFDLKKKKSPISHEVQLNELDKVGQRPLL